MGDLYDADVLAWSERQAALLRRQQLGEPANEAPDWANIIEEIESVGRSEFNAVWSLLVQALTHDLKCQHWPWTRYVPHWRAEARAFRADAAHRFTPSMRQRLDVEAIYRQALRGVPVTVDGVPGVTIPMKSGLTVDQLFGNGGDDGE